MSGESETPFEGVLRQINDTVPFEPGYYNESYLDRRITARMRRRDTESHTEYERLLREDDGEREALMDALTINVTEFFRNPEMWDALRGVLRERTSEQRRVRVWSAPSADGREPYSVDVGLRRPRDRRVTRRGARLRYQRGGARQRAGEASTTLPARPTSPRSWSRSRTLTATSSATRTFFGLGSPAARRLRGARPDPAMAPAIPSTWCCAATC